jgi:hypothetical protein
MSRSRPTLSSEVRALLDCERSVPPLSAAERTRALTRARAALVAGVPMAKLPSPARARWMRWTVLAAVLCVASAAIGAAAYEIRAHLAPTASHGSSVPSVTAPVLSETTMPLASSSATSLLSPSTLVPNLQASSSAIASSEQTLLPTDSNGPPTPAVSDTRGELHLLRQARAAVASENYAAALPLLAEHARRFKDGRLVEEREALRVKTLTGLGRIEDARRAAAAFQTRFPHSVLLPSVTQMPATGH